MRARIGDALRARGVAGVVEAATPEDADAALAAGEPGIVFMEFLGSPEEGARRVVDAMQRHPRAAVVLVTAEPPESPLVRRAVRMGAFAVLHKPLRGDDVRRALDAVEAESDDLVRLRA